ncbi:hypothetical protein RN001_014522 [Aquatica leii]|uniref:LRRNT domain-containing protein n=1 Tax=Aquatica leii TaxID=1421715 RepID=A0AAN7QBQ9_9COLE|nr:hypothetical protein RN001_014522 [Aquatica leii]
MIILSILLNVALISICWGRLNEEVTIPAISETNRSQCFYQPPSACPPPSNPCHCRRVSNTAAVCCNVDKSLITKGLACADIKNGKVIELHIRNATLDVLNVTHSAWRQLLSLAITDGSINRIVGEFGKHTTISCLNFSSNSINKFEDRSLVNLYNLSVLDLSHNNLMDVPRFKKEGIVTLDMSANKQLLCSHLVDALKRTELHFNSENETFCLSSNTFHWFNSTELVPLKQVVSVHELRKDCIINCTCEPSRLDIVPGKPPTFALFVNCSGLQLTSLPPVLPPNTIALNISNNNISSLELIYNEASYQNLRELDADNNEITSILPLEGSRFISNFNALSLRNNRLKTLPPYILSNIFDRNYKVRYVHLGLNRLQCDCTTARVLKEWLALRQKDIPDSDEIYCDNMEGRVIDLDPTKLCKGPHDWTDYIYFIITAEVLLLVFLIAKVSYDYWVFKTAGYLPWPASRMPKLPCDWLCE